MKVSRDLIEKYHQNLCTAQEKAAVEQWLALQELDDDASLSELGIPENELEASMWANVSQGMATNATPAGKTISPGRWNTLFRLSMAACLVMAVAGTVLWWQYTLGETTSVQLSNMENTTRRHVAATGLTVSMAPRSRADITTTASQAKGNISFCGAMTIETLSDLELTLNTTCHAGGTASEKVTCRKGETYILFNYRFAADQELVVVNRRDVADLPPALRRQVAMLF